MFYFCENIFTYYVACSVICSSRKTKEKEKQKQPFTDVLQNSCSLKCFLNIVKKTLMLESAFNKVAGLKVCIFIKKETPTQLFPFEYCKNLKNSFLYKTSGNFGYTVRISISWLFSTSSHTKIGTLVKCNFRTLYNVGSSING